MQTRPPPGPQYSVRGVGSPHCILWLTCFDGRALFFRAKESVNIFTLAFIPLTRSGGGLVCILLNVMHLWVEYFYFLFLINCYFGNALHLGALFFAVVCSTGKVSEKGGIAKTLSLCPACVVKLIGAPNKQILRFQTHSSDDSKKNKTSNMFHPLHLGLVQ